MIPREGRRVNGPRLLRRAVSAGGETGEAVPSVLPIRRFELAVFGLELLA